MQTCIFSTAFLPEFTWCHLCSVNMGGFCTVAPQWVFSF